MLSRLSISNYALISSLDITFPDGLIIITGETGAGKSILLGALSLLLGKKSDPSVFHNKEKNCVVEGEFADGTILRRVITPAGRSRSFLNDEPINLSDLSALSGKIIDIHQQHQHLLLGSPDYRLEVIDHFADNGELMSDYTILYNEHQSVTKEIKNLQEALSKAQSEAEYNQFRYSRLQDAALVDGELEELESEHKLLSSAEKILSDLYAVKNIFSGEQQQLSSMIKEASSLLSRCSGALPGADELSSRLDSCRIELDDIEAEVENYSRQVRISPERLEQVEERMSFLYELLRKYNCTTVSELIEQRDALAESVSSEEQLQQQLESLLLKQKNIYSKLTQLADKLTQKRGVAAKDFAKKLQSQVRLLEMPRAEIRVNVTKTDHLTPSGQDQVNFLFGANGSASIADISKVASGGELSRVMLSLKSIVAKYTSLPTMIFDEIDTGVSGKIADKMGDLIGEMGKNMQIFAITHLPQIASKPGAHFLVYKEYDEQDSARTYIRQLSENERVEEVARMLSGSQLTASAIQNARELINRSK